MMLQCFPIRSETNEEKAALKIHLGFPITQILLLAAASLQYDFDKTKMAADEHDLLRFIELQAVGSTGS